MIDLLSTHQCFLFVLHEGIGVNETLRSRPVIQDVVGLEGAPLDGLVPPLPPFYADAGEGLIAVPKEARINILDQNGRICHLARCDTGSFLRDRVKYARKL
jgi:hypothetical protein